jgi:hypothetical protein
LALSRLRAALDFLSDWAVLCFASWTLVAYLGMITEAKVSVLVPIWLATTPFLALALILLRTDSPPSAEMQQRPDPEPGASEAFRRKLPFIGVGAGLVAAALGGWASHLPWAVVWFPAFIAAGAAVAAGKLGSRAPAAAPVESSWVADLLAIGTGIAFAAMSLLLFRPNPDDIFYVNRATATAQLNRIPVLDVIFTHEEVARAGGAGLPVDSYSALQGALARLVGVEAPSVAYFFFPPVFTFLATWAVWRLVRAWAPRLAGLCFALGSVFWLWSAQFGLSPGNYFLTRIWQGKVAFVAWLIPTIYVYLSSWLGGRHARTTVLMLAAGVCSIGATGSATFVAPLVFLCALIPLAARLEWRRIAVPVAAAAIPLTIGAFVLWRFPLSESIGDEPLRAQSWFYHVVVGTGVVGVAAAVGLWAAPWIARAGPAERLTTGLAVVAAGLLVPGMIALLSDVSGLTGTLRRLLWIVPFPALVGLLAAVPLAVRVGKLVPVGPALAVVLGSSLIAFGAPLWTSGNTIWRYPPAWKMYLAPDARTVLQKYNGDGAILAPTGLMRAIALLTVEPKAVNARTTYLERTRETPERVQERLALTNFVMNLQPLPTEPEIRRALSDLDVGLVCFSEDDAEQAARIEELGSYRSAFTTSRFRCLER